VSAIVTDFLIVWSVCHIVRRQLLLTRMRCRLALV